MLRKFCIINTCGREDCGNHEQDHEHGAYYLVQDVDAHLAAIEEADNIWHEQTRLQAEALNARISELQTAWRYVLNASGNACENYTSGIGSCFRNGRTPDAKYGEDRCCWSCLANMTLMVSVTK